MLQALSAAAQPALTKAEALSANNTAEAASLAGAAGGDRGLLQRGLGLVGDYYLAFDLRVLPRRGLASVYRGQLWGSRNEAGPISRVVLYDDESVEPVRALIIQSGLRPQAWAWQPGMTAAEPLPESEWHAPLLPRAQISAFDLLMPYLYWQDFEFEGTEKILGRSAERFLLREPEGEGARGAAAISVRAYFDTQFGALLQAKLLSAEGIGVKTMTVRDLKKVSGQWMLKAIDLRNERTRDKARFEVRWAALELDLSPQVFAPETLGQRIQAPERLEVLGP